MSEREQCCECRFWKENEKDSEWGICRRYPTPEPAKLYFHWCGEYKQEDRLELLQGEEG